MFRRIRIRARPASFCSYHTPSIFPKNTPSSFSFQTVAIMSLFIPGSYADRPHNAQAAVEKLCGHTGISLLCTSGVTGVYGGRMLKNPASIVLASLDPQRGPGRLTTRRRAQTWCSLFVAPCARGYASGLRSLRPCWTEFLSILRD